MKFSLKKVWLMLNTTVELIFKKKMNVTAVVVFIE